MPDIAISRRDLQRAVRGLLRHYAVEQQLDTGQLTRLPLQRFYRWLRDLPTPARRTLLQELTAPRAIVALIEDTLRDPFLFCEFMLPLWSTVRTIHPPARERPVAVRIVAQLVYADEPLPDDGQAIVRMITQPQQSPIPLRFRFKAVTVDMRGAADDLTALGDVVIAVEDLLTDITAEGIQNLQPL
jgi:hypothetical protein